MGIQEAPTPKHWNFFLALEEDVFRLARYLEPTEANFTSYSLELARLLMAAASEVDVVAKQLCQEIDPDAKADGIARYRAVILAAYPQLTMAEAMIPKFGLTFKPWERWGTHSKPLWWEANNNVKHHRHTHFSEASLKHALNAVAGLFVLLLFFYRKEGQEGGLSPDPSIFRIGRPFVVDRLMYGPDVNLYKLAEQEK